MADYNTISGIKQRISEEIYENHAQEITGPILNQVLDDIVDTIAVQTGSHTNLDDIGIYTHNEIDAFINSKGSADGLASLNSDGKVPTTQLPNSILEYKGTWNADTNDPPLSDGDATNAGNVYRVSVAGTTDFGSGSISFSVGDYCIANENGTWEKADTTDAVSAVNGYTGNVTLDTDDISEGTNNKYNKKANWSQSDDTQDNYVQNKPATDVVMGYIMN